MNRCSENFNNFVNKIENAERIALNTEIGQEFTKKYLLDCLQKNPNMTAEQWKEKKSKLMTAIFIMFINENETARKEFAGHIYNEIIKGAVNNE